MSTVERRGKGVGHGGPARGYSWPPFQLGHTLSTKHGAYATLQLKPRAAEIAGWLAEQMGDRFEPKFSAAVEAAALAAARVEKALAHLADHDEATIEEKFSRLDDRARGWLRLYLNTLESLGLTPEVGSNVVSGPTTFIVVSAFGSNADVVDADAIEDAEVRALDAADIAGARDDAPLHREPTGTYERARDEQEKPDA